MPNETREARGESTPAIPVLLAWGMPVGEHPQGFMDTVGLFAGGAGLLLWTALALWLTA